MLFIIMTAMSREQTYLEVVIHLTLLLVCPYLVWYSFKKTVVVISYFPSCSRTVILFLSGPLVRAVLYNKLLCCVN